MRDTYPSASTTPCSEETPQPLLRVDRRTAAVVARTDLSAGTYLGRLSPAPPSSPRKGDALVLRAQLGPITVEREVTALQPGSAGGKLFVRDAEGQVTSALLAMEPE